MCDDANQCSRGVLAVVTLGKFAEEFEIDSAGGHLGGAGIGRGTNIRRAVARLEPRSLAHDTPRHYMPDDSSIDTNLEHAIQNEFDRRGLLTLAEQEIAGPQVPNRRPRSLHDPVRECSFQLRLRFRDIRSRSSPPQGVWVPNAVRTQSGFRVKRVVVPAVCAAHRRRSLEMPPRTRRKARARLDSTFATPRTGEADDGEPGLVDAIRKPDHCFAIPISYPFG